MEEIIYQDNMEEEEKVIIKLKRQPLKSEREEIKAKKRRKFLTFLVCFAILLVGIFAGYGISYLRLRRYDRLENIKFSEVKYYLENVWLYKNDYENLDSLLDDKALYGMTSFDDDPYTSYMSKEENKTFVNSINMDYVGIGVQYYSYNNSAIVTRVFKDSPAQKAGIRIGDKIIKVDGMPIEGLTSDKIKELVIGEEGTNVIISVLRDDESLDIKVKRGSVDSTVYLEEYDGDPILYIMSFGESTAKECMKYLADYRDRDRLIIDLRDNSGGLQTSVQEVAGLFVGTDVVYMLQEYSDGSISEDKTVATTDFRNLKKIVILVNDGTASAAEVFALCMKEKHKDVTLVGETTYGKGVVQSRYILSDGSTIKLTTSRWLSPSGKSINGEGIVPDEEVKLDELFYSIIGEMKDDETYQLDSVSNIILTSQRSLNYLGYECKRCDGYFDEDFEMALNKYKKDVGLKEDGILDKKTFDALLDDVTYIYSTDLSKDPQLTKAKEILKK